MSKKRPTLEETRQRYLTPPYTMWVSEETYLRMWKSIREGAERAIVEASEGSGIDASFLEDAIHWTGNIRNVAKHGRDFELVFDTEAARTKFMLRWGG